MTYLGYYDTDDNVSEQRNIVRAATTKMDYIASKLDELGYMVDIVSMSGTKGTKSVQGHIWTRPNGGKIVLFPSKGWGGPVKRVWARLHMQRNMKKYLQGLNKDDLVLAYHSLGYAELLCKMKKHVGFKLILEVEEFYSDVSENPEDLAIENRIFDIADAYLCSTELLADHLSPTRKPSAVCSGIYRMAPKVSNKLADGKTHIVYAGTLDPRKGGAAAAAAAAALDARYHMHILGFGSDKEIELISDAVKRANTESNGALISYDGYKTGIEFDRFIQSCHIGLSPQNPDAPFNKTSFPSKVFMYLCHGLPVVSVDLPVFRNEDLRSVLYLSEGNDPEALSVAIQNANFSKHRRPENVIRKLDADFSIELDRILKEVYR